MLYLVCSLCVRFGVIKSVAKVRLACCHNDVRQRTEVIHGNQGKLLIDDCGLLPESLKSSGSNRRVRVFNQQSKINNYQLLRYNRAAHSWRLVPYN